MAHAKWFFRGERRRWKAAQFRAGNTRCYLCGAELTEQEATVDHIIPRCAGGLDAAENYGLCCKQCNENKGCNVTTQARIAREMESE